MLEAMNEGKVAVATDGYGMRDVLSKLDPGLLVRVNDVEETARVIIDLIRHPQRRESLGHAGRLYVRSHLSWERVAEQYLALAGKE